MKYSRPTPIIRTFESKGKKYVYGYAAIFDSPDYYGTVITREAVEQSLPHLRSYPALRLMHRVPFGQILFDQEVEGIRTFIDAHGFHILAQVYDKFTDEWEMIHNGKWGFSYGFLPAKKEGIKTICLTPNECYESFVNGTVYEISVVDTPAHPQATAHTIERSLTAATREECSPSCDYHFACANFNPDHSCLGFQLKPNHELKRHIDNFDRLSLTRYIAMIHQTQSPSIKRELSKTVDRFLKPQEKRFTMINYEKYEISKDGSLSLPDPPPKPAKIPDPEPECMRMLRENMKKRSEKK